MNPELKTKKLLDLTGSELDLIVSWATFKAVLGAVTIIGMLSIFVGACYAVSTSMPL